MGDAFSCLRFEKSSNGIVLLLDKTVPIGWHSFSQIREFGQNVDDAAQTSSG